MIQKSDQQDIDRDGRRLLREALESAPLKWVLTGIDEDYGIDYDVQVFADGHPVGLWFKIQLKSSHSSTYSSDGAFVSVDLDVDHARHYALELRDPLLLIHADTRAKKIFWSALQLDKELLSKLTNGSVSSAVRIRIPTSNVLPESAVSVVETLERVHLVLGNRTIADSSIASFADSLTYQPGENKLREEYQNKNDILKLRKIREFFNAKQYGEARSRAKVVVSDPDSSIENRFWAQEMVGSINWAEAVSEDRPQTQLPLIWFDNAAALKALTKKGPSHLKFFAIIAQKAAELDQLAINNWGLTILLHQHSSSPAGNPFLALRLYSDQALSTKRVVAKYKQCLRLANYASKFRGRWILPRALMKIPQSMASFIARIGRMESEGMGAVATEFQSSILEVCKLIAWIGDESGDQEAIALGICSALLPATSEESDAFKWATRALDEIRDSRVRDSTIEIMTRQVKRWKGERLPGDRYADPSQQLLENAAGPLGIDLSDEKNPLVRGLRVAARDNSPERVLRTCEHMVTSLGAVGPTARQIAALFGTQMAASKILHCALHDYHCEGSDFDSALAEFKAKFCDGCGDRLARSSEWKFSEEVRKDFQAKHNEFIAKFNATGAGLRFTESDWS